MSGASSSPRLTPHALERDPGAWQLIAIARWEIWKRDLADENAEST
jgi:hypothetical protein